jgi:uncharacterized protein
MIWGALFRMKIEGKQFNCTQCGDCCKWEGFVLLIDDDIRRLADHEGLSLGDFTAKFTAPKHLKGVLETSLVDKKGTDECVYLKDNKCSVYDIRPKQCSEYPLRYDPKCGGFDTGDKIMKSKYEEAIKSVQAKLAGDTGEKAVLASLFENLDKNKNVASVISKAMDSGIDVYLKDERVKIASLSDLYAFTRVDNNHLVHKATRDLWSLEQGDEGKIVISRLFDDTGNPIRS